MLKLILIFASLLLFVGCEGEEYISIESLTVTVHFAIEDSIGDDEWQDFITIAVNSENVVTEVELNSVTPLANNSRRNVAQLEGFEDVFEYNFYDQASSLESSLIGISGDELADALRSAYHDDLVNFDTATFADLANHALASEPVEKGPYLDGTYYGIEAADANGLEYFVNLFVINGDIVAVHFNAVNHEGLLKYDQLIGTTADHDIAAWRYQAQLLEQALIQVQDPLGFSFDENGFTTDIPGVYMEIESFVSLVTQALSEGPVIVEIDE